MRRVCLVILMGLATAAHGQLAKERVGSNQLLIAGAGATSGANGTFFRSDITVLNYRTDADQRVFLNWVPQGVSGVGRAPVDIVIPKASGISSEDFVTSIMNQTGLGSILITAVTADGQLDLAGKLHATARIWSNQPGVSNGTVSQTFPIIALSANVLAEQVAEYTRAGMNAHLAKPINPRDLLTTIARWAGEEASEAEQLRSG